jgi:hypothetical protein
VYYPMPQRSFNHHWHRNAGGDFTCDHQVPCNYEDPGHRYEPPFKEKDMSSHRLVEVPIPETGCNNLTCGLRSWCARRASPVWRVQTYEPEFQHGEWICRNQIPTEWNRMVYYQPIDPNCEES